MSTLLKEVLLSVGSGAVAAVVVIAAFELIIKKIINNVIDVTFEKKLAKYTNSIDRATRAYDILIKKEFDFYELVDSPLASLIPLIVDMHDLAIRPYKFENLDVKEKYKEAFLDYLEKMMCIKGNVLVYQVYIPENIFIMAMNLIDMMQTNIGFFDETLNVLWEKKEGNVDIDQMKLVNDNILTAIAEFEITIKSRLQELSEID